MTFRPPSSDHFRVQRVEKPWGHEILWAYSDRYVGKILHVDAGHALSLQYHDRKDETLSLLSGSILLEWGHDASSLEARTLSPGDCFRVRPRMLHRLTATVDSDVLEASTIELDDVVRLDDRYGR